jgi:hypothetical protein
VPARGPVGRPGREGLRPDRGRGARIVKQAELDAGTRQDGGLTSSERQELAELRAENRRLRRMWRSSSGRRLSSPGSSLPGRVRSFLYCPGLMAGGLSLMCGPAGPGAGRRRGLIGACLVLDLRRAPAAWPVDFRFGFHPMTAWADHGQDGNGEPPAIALRAGNAGSNTAADHIEAARLSLAQLPRRLRRRVLVRADSGGGTHEFLTWLTARARRLRYSVGMTITEDIQAAIGKVPASAWTLAYDGDGQLRDGAWVADITGLLDLESWPAGMRVIVRKERPHPGAQLRFHRHRQAPVHLRHRHQARPARRSRTAPPQARQMRGPHPRRQAHRAAEPPAQELRPEPDLVRDRDPGL